jgi:hypothetical protein
VDDNTVKVLTLIISTVSALGLAYLGYLTLQANLAAKQVANVVKQTATDVREAAELVQTTAEETAREARSSAELVRSTLAASAADQLHKSDANAAKLDTIHGLVNSRLSTALAKIDALEARLFETEGRMPTGEPEPPVQTENAARSMAPPAITPESTAAADAARVDAENAQREARGG